MDNSKLSTINTVAAVIIAAVTIFGGAYLVFKNVDDTYARKDNPKINNLVTDYREDLADLKIKNKDEIDLMSKEYNTKFEEVLLDYEKRISEKEQELESVIENGKTDMDTQLNAVRADTVAVMSLQDKAKGVIDDLENEKQHIVRISGISQNGPNEGGDVGVLESRKLDFKKVQPDSVLKVTYTDNFRVTKGKSEALNQACRWVVKVGDNTCADKPIYGDRHDGKSSNVHSSGVISGYCEAVPDGNHKITVEVMPTPHETAYKTADCYTGWNA